MDRGGSVGHHGNRAGTGRPGWGGDVGRAARSLRRSPGFALLSVATLALGVGTLTAMFSVLDQVVLEPLPVERQERLVVAWHDHVVRDFPHYPFTLEAYEAVREGVPALEAVAATPGYGAFRSIVGTPDGREETLGVALAVGDLFGALGVRPAAGRTLRSTDDVAGAARVAVISWDLWTSRWSRSLAAVGSTLELSPGPYTVVGVLPRGFEYPAGADVWVPFTTSSDEPVAELDLVARMADGVVPATVAEQIQAVYRAAPADFRHYEGAVPVVRPFRDVVLGDLGPTLLLLFGGATLVLLTASVNVASLVRVRTAGREPILAVRRALGAGTGRLVREAVAEAGLLGLAGGLAGAGLAAAALRLLLPLAPADLPRLDEVVALHPTALAVAAGVTGLVVLLLTVVPVLRAARADPAAALRTGGRSGGGGAGGARRWVVAFQPAMAVWTAAVGLLLLRSLLNLQGLDPGFRVDDLVLVELSVPYPNFDVPEDLPDRFERIGRRIEAHPAVRASSALLSAPLSGAGAWAFIPRLEGQTAEESVEDNPYVNLEIVEPDLFATLELPVLGGRPFGPADGRDDAPVVVVNEAAASTLWPGEEALGRRLVAGFPGMRDRWWTVVGVVESARYQDLLERRPVVYFPVRQMAVFPLHYVAVRVAGDWTFLPGRVRRALAEVDPAIRLEGVRSLRSRLEEPLVRPRFAALLLGALAGVTLLLAAVGVYGVMAASVRERTREMGVRLACGAAPGDVSRTVLARGMRMAAAGSAVGALAVLPGAAALESLLFGIAPSDPGSLAGAAALVLAVALASCWGPAARAARLDPARVLRSD